MNSIRISRRGKVHCQAILDLPLSATAVWGQLRDFRRFAQKDFFHADIAIEGDLPRAGATLVMWHRYAGMRLRRVGRILVWREGVGFSFSDVSRRGPRAGFPHVFGYRIMPIANDRCTLRIEVRGRWTAWAIPRWLASLWLRWVFGHVVRTVRNELLLYRVWRERNKQSRKDRT